MQHRIDIMNYFILQKLSKYMLLFKKELSIKHSENKQTVQFQKQLYRQVNVLKIMQPVFEKCLWRCSIFNKALFIYIFQVFEVSSMFINVDFLLNEFQILLVTKINEITVIRLYSNQFWLFIDTVGNGLVPSL